MNYGEIKKQATQGPFYQDTDGFIKGGESADVIVADFDASDLDIAEREANKALFLHSVNNFDKVLEALKRDAYVLEAVSDIKNDAISYDRYCELVNLIAELEEVK